LHEINICLIFLYIYPILGFYYDWQLATAGENDETDPKLHQLMGSMIVCFNSIEV